MDEIFGTRTVTGTQLDSAADCLVAMRTAWQQLDQAWDAMITERRLLPTPAMTEASDLLLRMGRLVWDNPHWTPARCARAPRRTPAALAPGSAAINTVMAAAHQAVDALALAAMTDIDAVQLAGRAGRLYVPTRSLPADDDVPRPFAPAPAARCRALHDAYHAALHASITAAHALDALTLAARAPSMTLARAGRGIGPVPPPQPAREPLPPRPAGCQQAFHEQPRIERPSRIPGASDAGSPRFRPGHPAPRRRDR